jgi:CHAT domain-containing protein
MRRGAWIGAVGACVLSSFGAAAQEKVERQIGEEWGLGANLVGEQCRARFVSERSDQKWERYEIFCEGWEQRSGTLIVNYRPELKLEPLLRTGSWKQARMANDVSCSGDIKAFTLTTGDKAESETCITQAGGYPQQFFSAVRNRRAYVGEALPAAFPLLEEAILILDGTKKAVVDRGQIANASLRFIEAQLSAGVRGIGARDMNERDALWRLGNDSINAGQFARAQSVLRRLLSAQEKSFGIDAIGNARVMIRLAHVMSRRRDYEGAEAMFLRAKKLVASQGADSIVTLEYLAYHGSHYARSGDTQRGIGLIEDSLKSAVATTRPNKYRLWQAYDKAAETYIAMERWTDAERTSQEALRQAHAAFGNVHSLVRSAHHKLGQVYEGTGRLEEALKSHRTAMEMVDLLYGDSWLVAVDLYGMGRVQGKLGRPQDALASFRRGTPILARMGSGNINDGFPFEDYASLAFAEAAKSPAQAQALIGEVFAALQLRRGTTAATAARLLRARLAAGDEATTAVTRDYQDAQNAARDARERLGLELAQPPEQRNAEAQAKLERELSDAKAREAAAERALQAANPRYARLAFGRPESADDVRKLLAADEALLALYPMKGGTAVFVVRKDKVAGYMAKPGTDAVAKAVAHLRAGLEPEGNGVARFDLAAAHALYRDLLASAEKSLAGAKHLYIVGTQALASLPFGVLVRTAPAAGAGYQSAAWLGRQYSMSALPSVAALRDVRSAARDAKAAKEAFFGVGNPSLSGDGGAASRGALLRLAETCVEAEGIDVNLVRSLPALPETADELRRISESLGANAKDLLLGPDANAQKLRASGLSDYRVLAFATHGVLPAELQCNIEPGLILSPTTGEGAHSGLLRASEIAKLKLNAELVLLSACNTAGADGRLGGESYSGLVQAFFYAGARAVLASHWAVASEPTVQLTTGIFEAQKKTKGLKRAEALMAVQAQMMQNPDTAHPIFWAPFVLVGDRG